MKSLCPKILVLLLIFVYGCATQKIALDPKTEPAKIVSLVNKNHKKLNTFLGQASISVETQSFNQSFNADVIFKKPEPLFLNVKTLLVGSIAKVLADSTEFKAYNKLKNEIYLGKTSSATIEDFIGVAMGFEELTRVLTGLEFFSPKEIAKLEGFKIDDDKFLFTFENESYLRKIWVEPQFSVITKSQIIDLVSEEVILEKKYKNFVKTKGVYLPKAIKVKNLANNQYLLINYRTQKVNKKLKDKVFELNYPSSAKQIEYITSEDYGKQ